MKNDYFIIESLNENDVHDGKIFFNALRSVKKYSPIYKKVYTVAEFETALIEFSQSNLKYLFVSSHGDIENIILVDGKFNAYDLNELDIGLQKRRVFMSTCEGGSFLFARYFMKKGVYSVIGCPEPLDQI